MNSNSIASLAIRVLLKLHKEYLNLYKHHHNQKFNTVEK